ncbi:MAG: sulfur carrier protein ThiS [Planctomycetota bacterium]
MGEEVKLVLNGKETDVAAGTTIGELVDRITSDRSRIAVERNREIVKRDTYDVTSVEEGDVIEVVTLVGGG